MFDRRSLGEVLFHTDHEHRPDIQYSGSEKWIRTLPPPWCRNDYWGPLAVQLCSLQDGRSLSGFALPALSRFRARSGTRSGAFCATTGTGLSTKNFKFFGTYSFASRRNRCGAPDRHMKQRKDQLIKARVSTDIKRGIDDLADERGESEAVIVREALSQYLTSKQKCNRQDWSSVNSDRSAKRRRTTRA